MSPLPHVTVVMPVHNGGIHLSAAVRSIRLQTYANWDMLVLDDGSSDGATTALADLQDPRIRVVRSEKAAGIAVRLNEGIRLAKGEYVARMDADDVSFPDRLAKQVHMLAGDESIDLVGTCAVLIDESGGLVGRYPRKLAHEEICRRPWLGFHLVHPSWMGRASWFRAHPYSEPAPYACEDQDLLLRTHVDSRFACVPEVLFAYRLRSRVDWVKLARTRSAWLQCQKQYFRRTGDWSSIVLSSACYGLRTTRDAWMRLLQRHYYEVSVDEVHPDLVRRWHELCFQGSGPTDVQFHGDPGGLSCPDCLTPPPAADTPTAPP